MTAVARLWCLGPIALLALQAFAVPALAQGAVKIETERLSTLVSEHDEILVVAQGRLQRLRDVPISASVVSGVDIQSWNLNDLQAITASVPGVRISPGPGADHVHIRGVGSGENAGFEQSVSTFVDGAYRGRGRAIHASLFDVEQVEVLKGPQTTFFGNNAIAGAFNIVTRKPAREALYDATALYAPADGEYALEAGISTPVSPTLSVRLAGKLSGMDGYTRNAVNGELGPHLRDFVGRVSVRWEPSPTWELDARVDYGRNRDTEQSQYQLVNCPPPAAFGNPIGVCARQLAASGDALDDRLDYDASIMPSFFHYDFVEASMTNRWRIRGANLKWISSYFRHDFSQMNTVFPVDYPGIANTPFVHNVFNGEVVRSFSNEARLESEDSGDLKWMIGAYHAHSELSADLLSGSYFAPLGLLGAPYFDAETPFANLGALNESAETRSAFASASVRLSDAVRLNLGARYTRVSKQTERRLVFGSAFPKATFDTFVPAPDAVQLQIADGLDAEIGPFDKPSRGDDKFMPSASVQYEVTPQVMAYLSYANGFKAGGYALNSVGNMFDAETVNAYEIGIKGTARNRAVSFNLAAYRSDYDNLQESTADFRVDGSIIFLVKNVATSRSQGVDFSASARASQWFTLRADIGYLDAVYRSFTDGPCTAYQQLTRPAPCIQDLSGKRKAFAPTWSGSIGATLTARAGNIKLRADPLVYFTSSYYGQATADRELLQKAYAKFDLRIAAAHADGRWEIALIGRNLTDKATTSYRNSLPTSPGSSFALVERPRSLAIQVLVRH